VALPPGARSADEDNETRKSSGVPKPPKPPKSPRSPRSPAGPDGPVPGIVNQ
jgi:hypothetical protein